MTQEIPSLPIRAMDCLQRCYHLREYGVSITTDAMRERLQSLEPGRHLGDATVTFFFQWLLEPLVLPSASREGEQV